MAAQLAAAGPIARDPAGAATLVRAFEAACEALVKAAPKQPPANAPVTYGDCAKMTENKDGIVQDWVLWEHEAAKLFPGKVPTPPEDLWRARLGLLSAGDAGIRDLALRVHVLEHLPTYAKWIHEMGKLRDTSAATVKHSAERATALAIQRTLVEVVGMNMAAEMAKPGTFDASLASAKGALDAFLKSSVSDPIFPEYVPPKAPKGKDAKGADAKGAKGKDTERAPAGEKAAAASPSAKRALDDFADELAPMIRAYVTR